MADTKITALTALTAADPANDVIPIVDVSDTSMAASGTTKKISVNNILGASGTATLASATITGAFGVNGTANFNGGALAANLNGFLMFGSSGNTVNFFAQSNGFAFKENTGANNLLTISNAGSFVFGDGAGGTRMTLNATGLAIGGTALGKFTAYSTTNGDTLAVFRCTGTGTQRGLYLSADNSTGVVSIDISGSSAGSLQFKSGGTNTMLIDTSGNVGIGVAPSAGGGCLQLKSGITFPATQVASSDANTLDDYEEGTWTGTIGGTTGNPTTPVTATGRYTKIGRQVYVEIGFYGDTTGASGRITVSGLPFTSNASTARPGAILMDTMGTFTGSPVAFLGSGVTSLDLYASNSNGSLSNVTHNAGAGRALYMELTYTV